MRGKENKKQQDFYEITVSQGREALVGSLFLCESALHATKPPNPTVSIDGLTLDLCQDKFKNTRKIG